MRVASLASSTEWSLRIKPVYIKIGYWDLVVSLASQLCFWIKPFYSTQTIPKRAQSLRLLSFFARFSFFFSFFFFSLRFRFRRSSLAPDESLSLL